MSDLPFLPLWVSKYEARTAHLTLEEDGAYTRLLRLSWVTPNCQIPDDDAWIMRRMRVDQPTFERAVKPILVEFFYKEKGAWRNERLRAEWDARTRSKTQKVEAGRRGGKNRARKENGKDIESASPPLEADAKRNPSMPESRIHSQKACKQALGELVLKALGNGVAELDPAVVDDAIEAWQRLGASDTEIVDTVRRQTLHRRKKPLRSLAALTPDIEAAIAARRPAPAQSPPREARQLVPPESPTALQCLNAIVASYGMAAAEAWLAGAVWLDDEVLLPTEFARAQVDNRFGGVLRNHGFSAAIQAS